MISDFPMLSDILFETDEFLELQDNIKESNSYSFRILNQNSITQEYSSLFRTSHFQLPNLIIILTNRMKQGIFNLVKKGNTSKIIETRKQFLVNECLISCQTPNNLAAGSSTLYSLFFFLVGMFITLTLLFIIFKC